MPHEIYDYVFTHPVLNKAIDILSLKQFLRQTQPQKMIAKNKNEELSCSELNKAVFLASVLASSDKEEHQQKAMSLAILSYLDNKNYEFASYCYIILSRVDVVQQGQHLHELVENNKFLSIFDEALMLELSAKRALASLQLPGIDPIIISHFQRDLWNELQKADRIIAISGPTSSGKSYMVQNYIIDLCKIRDSITALYIVPTRALISEVSSELRNKLANDNVSIKVAVGQAEELCSRQIFVLTPERCLQILRDATDQMHIDFIFMDEIQKVEDSDRGVIFEYVLNELMRMHPHASVVLAGPYLKNLKRTITQLTYEKGNTVESSLSPVYQLKTIFTLSKSSELLITVKNTPDSRVSTTIHCPPFLYQLFKSHPIPAMASFVDQFGEGSTNIIYAPTRTHAEKYAIELAKLKPKPEKMDKQISQLIDYLSKEIHPHYTLIRCLRKGVAFHHGMIPEMAKSEIEDLYRNGVIKNLSCTTTLLEGVNLPADRLFIYKPYKNNSTFPLDNFDFGNLIGRAGRVFAGLNGSVYCVELENEKWAEEKLSAYPEKEITPVTDKATSGMYKQRLFDNLEKSATEMNVTETVISTIIFLRQKAIRDTAELARYLKNKNLSDEETTYIHEKIVQSINNIGIPKEIVRLNPTVDPILQGHLYDWMLEDGWSKWLITKPPLLLFFGKKYRHLPFENKPFYYQFEEITERLDKVFRFCDYINYKQQWSSTKHWSPYSIALYGSQWIQQAPMSYIINNELWWAKKTEANRKKRENEPEEKDERKIKKEENKLIDRTILQVSRHINNEVRFELVKYFKLWADILDFLMSKEMDDIAKKKYDYNLSLPLMLELGAHDPKVISLIRLGIARSVAIEASEYLPTNIAGNAIDEVLKPEIFNRLSSISQRHLLKLGFKPIKAS